MRSNWCPLTLWQIIGWKPSDDPKADMLINANLNHTDEELNLGGGVDDGSRGKLLVDKYLSQPVRRTTK